jgi:hypothetical protein
VRDSLLAWFKFSLRPSEVCSIVSLQIDARAFWHCRLASHRRRPEGSGNVASFHHFVPCSEPGQVHFVENNYHHEVLVGSASLAHGAVVGKFILRCKFVIR